MAERSTCTFTRKARTQLLHAQLRWSKETPTSLWPMSPNHAVQLINVTPKVDEGMSPDELFFRTTSNHQNLLRLMAWGCPGCALMPSLQDGKKLPKWKPQSRRCQCMGWSPMRASSMGLVGNLCTGHVSPQFHVVHEP